MIICFSGTGNSRYIAKRIAGALHHEIKMLGYDSQASLGKDVKTLGLVFPIYSWGVPPIVLQWIKEQTGKAKPDYVWAVMSCGDETGDAPDMLRRAMAKAGLQLNALYSIQMPNNYVLLPGFDVDPKEIEHKKLIDCEQRINHVIQNLRQRPTGMEDVVRGKWSRLKTKLIYPLFAHFGISAKHWKVDASRCNVCGLCAMKCPMKNITLKNERPLWGKECVSCLSCYHVCPRHAIFYAKATKGKGHYYNRK